MLAVIGLVERWRWMVRVSGHWKRSIKRSIVSRKDASKVQVDFGFPARSRFHDLASLLDGQDQLREPLQRRQDGSDVLAAEDGGKGTAP